MLPATKTHSLLSVIVYESHQSNDTLHKAKLTLPTSSTNWVPFVLKIDAACDLHIKIIHAAMKNLLAAAIAITIRLG